MQCWTAAKTSRSRLWGVECAAAHALSSLAGISSGVQSLLVLSAYQHLDSAMKLDKQMWLLANFTAFPYLNRGIRGLCFIFSCLTLSAYVI